MLLDKGYSVVAVDFSAASLRINAKANAKHRSRVMYVAADLNDLLDAMTGAIRYRRSQVSEVLAMLPSEIETMAVCPMNVFHSATADRLATKLPFSFLLARMIVVIGRRRSV
jgi:hypothetical protein